MSLVSRDRRSPAHNTYYHHQPVKKSISSPMLSFLDYPRLPSQSIPSVHENARRYAADSLRVNVADLEKELSVVGPRMMERMELLGPSVRFANPSSNIPRLGNVAFTGNTPVDPYQYMPTHILVVVKADSAASAAAPQGQSRSLFAFPTHAPILVSSCASVDPLLAHRPSQGSKLNIKDPLNFTGHPRMFDLTLPTVTIPLPEPLFFAPLHDWLYTKNTMELVDTLLSARSPSGTTIPTLPIGYVRLLGASAQPEARQKARSSLFNCMLESFNVDAFLLLLNRVRGVKVNAVKLQIRDEDLHATLDGLWETAYKACQAVVQRPGAVPVPLTSGGYRDMHRLM